MKDLDEKLLQLLKANGRESITALAKKLGVSRATVQERMQRLERNRIILGYTIRYHPEYRQRQVGAYVMIAADPKETAGIVRQLEKVPEVQSLQSISGLYDFMALVRAETTESLDRAIDLIGDLEGVEKTMTSIILSLKFQR